MLLIKSSPPYVRTEQWVSLDLPTTNGMSVQDRSFFAINLHTPVRSLRLPRAKRNVLHVVCQTLAFIVHGSRSAPIHGGRPRYHPSHGHQICTATAIGRSSSRSGAMMIKPKPRNLSRRENKATFHHQSMSQ